MNFGVFQVSSALHVELRLELGRGGLDHRVLGARGEVGLVFSEQVSSAAALATEFLARGPVGDGVPKDIAIEGELVSLGGARVCSVAEDAAGEGVGSTHLHALVGRHTAGLHSAPLSVLVVEDVRVLVRRPSRLRLQGYFSKVRLSLVLKCLSMLMIRLSVEDIASICVRVSRFSFVIDHVLFGMANDVSVVLPCFECSCFHMAGIKFTSC